MASGGEEGFSDPWKRSIRRCTPEAELRKQLVAAKALRALAEDLFDLFEGSPPPLDVLGVVLHDSDPHAWTAESIHNVLSLKEGRLDWWIQWEAVVRKLFTKTSNMDPTYPVAQDWNRVASGFHKENITLQRSLAQAEPNDSRLRRIRCRFRSRVRTLIDQLLDSTDRVSHLVDQEDLTEKRPTLKVRSWRQCTLEVHPMQPEVKIIAGKGTRKSKAEVHAVSTKLWNALQLLQLGPSDLSEVSGKQPPKKIAYELRTYLRDRVDVQGKSDPVPLDKHSKKYSAAFGIRINYDAGQKPQITIENADEIPDPKTEER